MKAYKEREVILKERRQKALGCSFKKLMKFSID